MGGVGATSLSQVLFLPTSLGEAEQTFIIVCDNCQIKELAISGGLACVPSGGAGAAARVPEAAALALVVAQQAVPTLSQGTVRGCGRWPPGTRTTFGASRSGQTFEAQAKVAYRTIPRSLLLRDRWEPGVKSFIVSP